MKIFLSAAVLRQFEQAAMPPTRACGIICISGERLLRRCARLGRRERKLGCVMIL